MLSIIKKFFKSIGLNDYINFILAIICALLSFYLSNNSFLFGNNPNQKLDVWLSIVLTLINISSFAVLIIINVIKGKYRPNKYIITCLILIFVINTFFVIFNTTTSVTFLSYDKSTHINVSLSFSTSDKVTNILSFLGTVLGMALILDVLHKIFNLKKILTIISLIILIACTVFIIISYIKFGNRYFLLYQHLIDGELYHASIPSIFQTKNEYALVLYVGLLSGILIHQYYKKWFIFVPIIYMYINIIHSLSKSMIIIGLLTILIYLFLLFAFSYKDNKKRNLTLLAIFGGAFFTVGLTAVIVLLSLNKFDDFLKTIYLVKGNDTFITRQAIWNKAIAINNSKYWIFGSGHGLYGETMHACNQLDYTSIEATARYSAHNAFLQYIGEGGLFFLVAEILLLAYSLFCGIKHFKENQLFISLSFLVLALFFILMFLESATIGLSLSLDYGLITLFVITPLLSMNKK